MKTVKLAIVGSRDFNDFQLMKDKISENYERVDLIISGGARGADTLAERYALENNIETLIFKADWKTYGKRAGFIRNVDIIKSCTDCIAFWDGESHGTEHDLELCEEMGVPCKVWLYKENRYMKKKWERLMDGEWMITGESGNSMTPILTSGQKVVLKPMPSLEEIEVGDIVYSRVSGNFVTHLVKGKDEKRGLLIGNNHGHLNGWTKAVYGKVVGIITKKPTEEFRALVSEGDEAKILTYIKEVGV